MRDKSISFYSEEMVPCSSTLPIEGQDTIVGDVENQVDAEDQPRLRVKEGLIDLRLLEGLAKCRASVN